MKHVYVKDMEKGKYYLIYGANRKFRSHSSRRLEPKRGKCYSIVYMPLVNKSKLLYGIANTAIVLGDLKFPNAAFMNKDFKVQDPHYSSFTGHKTDCEYTVRAVFEISETLAILHCDIFKGE